MLPMAKDQQYLPELWQFRRYYHYYPPTDHETGSYKPVEAPVGGPATAGATGVWSDGGGITIVGLLTVDGRGGVEGRRHFFPPWKKRRGMNEETWRDDEKKKVQRRTMRKDQQTNKQRQQETEVELTYVHLCNLSSVWYYFFSSWFGSGFRVHREAKRIWIVM